MKGLAVAAMATIFCWSHSTCYADISLNFSENTNQVFSGGENIGPLASDSANWNNPADFFAQAAMASNSLNDLVDHSGSATTTDVTWSSSNLWYTAGGTGDDQHRLGVGYLDDGGNGVSVTFTDIPYANYIVYGLLASDQELGDPIDTYTTVDFAVNGIPVFGSTAPAYNSVDDSFAATGSFWSPADGVNAGNYWTAMASGSTLVIQGNPRNGAERGSLAAVVIQEVVPEPSTVVMALLLLGGIVAVRSRG
jgi:hypothetical protein